MDIQKILNDLSFESLDCDYADIRIEQSETTLISYQEDELQEAVSSPSLGAFLRVLKDGNWAFKSTTEFSSLRDDFEKLCLRASLLPNKEKVHWPKREAKKYTNIHYKDNSCLKATLQEKKNFLETLIPVLKSYEKVNGAKVTYKDLYKEKWFKASDGVEYHYDYNHAGAAASYTLKDGEKIFPDYVGFFFQNVIGESDKAIEKLKKEIEAGLPFLDAKTITPGKYKCVLSPEITGVFTHESFGHKSEADFMLGDEAMKEEWQIGKKVGADHLTIIDDGDWPNTTGHVPVDDEGNLKEKTYLIKNGKLAGRLHSTSTAIALDERPTGNARAMNFEFEPIPRMTNTYIEAGTKSFEELIAPIKEGIYIVDFKHGMGMSTFTIAPVKSYWIRDGKIAEPVRVSVISGNVFETLNLIEDIGNDFDVKSSALGGCGKFEQAPLPVADGGPSIVVKEMTVS